MPVQTKATIATELSDVVGGLLANSIAYRNPNEFQIKQLFAEAKKLIAVDAISGHIITGLIYQLCGDTDMMRYHMENASRLGNPIDVMQARAVGECNLGYFSVAAMYFEGAAEPKRGGFTSAFGLGLVCGAFHKLSAFISEAEKMKIDLQNLPVSEVRRAEKVLLDGHVTDEQIGVILDLAGEVLRSKSLFYAEDLPEIDIADCSWDFPKCVYLRYRVQAAPADVAQMTDALAEKVASRIEQVPDAFHVAFCPV